MSKFRFQLLIIFILFIVFMIPVLADEPESDKLSIKINGEAEQLYQVQRALLFRQVKVEYDSTVLIQNDTSSQVYYYPQLDAGKENVLRLLVGTINNEKQDFFDFFINLGDSVRDSLTFKDDSADIFIARNGKMQLFKSTSQNINGFLQVESKKEKVIAGQMDLSFTIKNYLQINQTENFQIKGSFGVTTGDYRELNMGMTTKEKETKSKRRHALYLAIIVSVFFIAIFGLR
jgi:hypothetical protein